MADSTGMADLRAENVDRIVKGFALQKYVGKQMCMIQSSSAEDEIYYQETAAELTAKGETADVEGVPRLAKFPYGEVTWTKVTGRHLKHAIESVLSWEDIKNNNIPMIARTLLRISRAVVKSVDENIMAKILSAAGNIQAANATWNNSVIADRDPIQDILDAKAKIALDNYDSNAPGNLLLNPTNAAELLGNSNIRNVGQFYSDAVTRNGFIGHALGLNWLVSNSVTEGGAQIVIGKPCNWKTNFPLTTHMIDDPGIKKTIRAWERGQIQVVEPDAICSITGI